jgi:hypothetical protein
MALLPALMLCVMQSHAQTPAPRQEQDSLERQMCAEARCQRNLRVVLKKKDGTVYDRTFPVFAPTAQDFGVTVVAGQTIYVEADVVDGKLANYRAVEKVVDPGITITAKFEQLEDGGMMLSLHNPFDKPVKFNMGITPLDSNGLYKTSSCPVGANGNSFEMWPEPIFQVVFGNGRLLEAGAAMTCIE